MGTQESKLKDELNLSDRATLKQKAKLCRTLCDELGYG